MHDIATLQARLDELLRIAKSNERKQENFQQYELALLNSTSLHELLSIILDQHKDRFQLTEVTLMLYDPEYEIQRLVESKIAPHAWTGRLIFSDSAHLINQHFSPQRKPRLLKYSPHQHAYLFPEQEDLGSVALLPLMRQNHLFGCLNLGSRNASRFQGQIGTLFLEHLAAVVSACIENARLHEHIKLVGLHDALTGINNRRFFDQRLSEEVSRAQRSGSPLSCLFIDLDHFKRVNDQYGHQAGDAVLKQVSRLLSDRLRQTDVLARYGGEEFIILLADTAREDAALIAEQIRDRVAKAHLVIPSGKTLNITLSIGVATMLVPGAIKDGRQLIAMADQAVYAAKLSGRNRVKQAR
jgi:two-component system cell cycle response regulator